MAQAASGQLLHHQQAQAVAFHVVVDADDVGMVESGQDPGLRHEAFPDVLEPACVLVQDFDRDIPADQPVAAGEHGAEASTAEFVTDVVVR